MISRRCSRPLASSILRNATVTRPTTARQCHQLPVQKSRHGEAMMCGAATRGFAGQPAPIVICRVTGRTSDAVDSGKNRNGVEGGWRRGLHHQAAASDKKVEEVVTYSSPKTNKTVDKSDWLNKGEGRFAMDRPFPGLPPLKPPGALKRPETITTVLPNGLTVATQETYGALCSFGVVIDAGSRLETDENTGVCHLLELMACKSTEKHSHKEIVRRLEEMGAVTSTHGSREQMLFAVDVLRDNIEPAMELWADAFINARCTSEEVEEQKTVMKLNIEDMSAPVVLKESLASAAFDGQPLGRPYWCPPAALPKVNATMAKAFRKRYFTAKNMVLAGAGVDHNELVRLAEKYLGGMPEGDSWGSSTSARNAPSLYTGGQARTVMSSEKEKLTRMAIAFQIGGWNDRLVVAACVLQILLGGGDSFSAGGPGKGMYSRLYREVLNKFYWTEAAEAFTIIQDEAGLLGMAGAAVEPVKAAELLHIFCQQFAQLASTPVTDVELSRARNMLKCNVLTHLESRMVLFEDIARQMITHGRRESAEEICAKIDAVTADDILEIVRRAMSTPPTISVVGSDIEHFPTFEDVRGWFSSGASEEATQASR